MMVIAKGSVVGVTGAGVGYITNITHGRLPYHVKVVEGPRAGATFRCAESHFHDVDVATKARVRGAQTLAKDTEKAAFFDLALGTVVRVDSASLNPDNSLHVVIGVVKNGRVKVARLGGDENRYLTVSLSRVTRVALEDIRA